MTAWLRLFGQSHRMGQLSPQRAGAFPHVRMRRSRQSPWVRDLTQETHLRSADLILPLFVIEGRDRQESIGSLPTVDRLSIDLIVQQAERAYSLGIPAIALFPAVDSALKTEGGSEAINPDSLICRTIRVLKKEVPDIGIICDVALDPYTTHGHDGVLRDGTVNNDETVNILVQQALTLAASGCDVVAPSDMMDGRVGAIRAALESDDYTDTMILSYAAKYASCFYGPFREAVGSSQSLGKTQGPLDKKTYQMNPANAAEALREVLLDVAEGADMVMVKPGMPYLDVLRDITRVAEVPVLAYQVSGEYAMLSLGASQGLFDKKAAFHESLLAFKRAGARGIFTYAALEVAEHLKEDF